MHVYSFHIFLSPDPYLISIFLFLSLLLQGVSLLSSEDLHVSICLILFSSHLLTVTVYVICSLPVSTPYILHSFFSFHLIHLFLLCTSACFIPHLFLFSFSYFIFLFVSFKHTHLVSTHLFFNPHFLSFTCFLLCTIHVSFLTCSSFLEGISLCVALACLGLSHLILFFFCSFTSRFSHFSCLLFSSLLVDIYASQVQHYNSTPSSHHRCCPSSQ